MSRKVKECFGKHPNKLYRPSLTPCDECTWETEQDCLEASGAKGKWGELKFYDISEEKGDAHV